MVACKLAPCSRHGKEGERQCKQAAMTMQCSELIFRYTQTGVHWKTLPESKQNMSTRPSWNHGAGQAGVLTSLISLLFFLSVLLFFPGCASRPAVTLPQLDQDRIKAHKTVRVYANRSMPTATGVTVSEGDLYSLVITGRVGTNRWNQQQLGYDGVGPRGRLWVIIDGEYQTVPPINSTIDARVSGEIALRVRDEGGYGYKDNTGSFDATIIVWETQDIDFIVDYFKQLAELNPDIKAPRKTHAQTVEFRDYRAESQQAVDTAVVRMEAQTGMTPGEQELQHIAAKDQEPLEIAAEEQVALQEPPIEATTPVVTEAEEIVVSDSPAEPAPAKEIKDLHAPLMLIVSPRENQTIASITIQLIGVIEDDAGLQKVEILINDEPLDLSNKRGIKISSEPLKRYEFSEEIPLVEGKSEVKIRAVDVNDRMTEKFITVHREKQRTRVWAAIIGIDTYPNLPHLSYTVLPPLAPL